MALKVGDKAPEFKLFNTEKKEVSLSDFKGQTVVLHFFPAAFTGGCTAQMCTLRDDYSFYNNLNCVVLGCSCDSPFTLGKFKTEQALEFDLLSDYNKETCKDYDAQYETWILGMKGNSRRAAFIINGDGVIVYSEALESAGDQVNFAAMKEVLEKI
ncbi:MAG: peroxiredoxin [Bacteroidetes bacterium]|nr:peroxiredoxin [Bacteroidota bacterium]